MLHLWRLQLLREVVRRGTVRAAADALHISPSAVSQQLNLLAAETGLTLFERSGRRLRPTEAALRLAEHTEVISGAVAAAEAEIAALRGQLTGTLRLAAFPTAARAIMPAVMAALGRRHPALRITLRDLEADESLAALETDDLDLALVDHYAEPDIGWPTSMERHWFLDDPLYLALPLDWPLTGPARLADLRDAPWIMDTETSHLYRVVVAACRAAGFQPRIRSHCKDYGVILALVEAGLGVAVVPGLAVQGREVSARLEPLDPPLVRRVGAAYRRQRGGDPAIRSVLAELDRLGGEPSRITSSSNPEPSGKAQRTQDGRPAPSPLLRSGQLGRGT
jgi:DNA-binding transcriptional LysR family regulator